MNMTRIIAGAAFMLVFYGGSNFYIGRRLFQWLRFLFPHINAAAYTAVFAAAAVLPLLMFLPLDTFRSYWMGVFVYLLFFLLTIDIFLLFGTLVKIIPRPAPALIRFCAASAAIVLMAGCVVYGVYHARQVTRISYTLPIGIKDGMNIVLVSDLHLGAADSERRLQAIVQNINQCDADIVCITGDIFNNDYNAIKNPERVVELLRSITSKYGVYACLGNHDAGRTFNQMLACLERGNVKLLADESVIIDGRLALAGRVDGSPIGGFGGLRRKPAADVLAPLKSTGLPVVVMDHSPSHIKEYGGETALVLCGHTHKGQIFPGNLFTKALYTVDYGHYQKDGPHVIVTSGAGTWGPPMRVGTNSEVVEIKAMLR